LLQLGVFLNTDNVGSLAPIATVIFEWKAGSPFPNNSAVSLQNKINNFRGDT